MTLNEVRKQYKQDKKLYEAVGNIIDTLKSVDDTEIRKVGLYFNISWKDFSKQAKFSKKRIDQTVFVAIICGVLGLEHCLFKVYDSEKYNADLEKIITVGKMVYSYKYKGKLDVYRTGFGNKYASSSFAVDLTV